MIRVLTDNPWNGGGGFSVQEVSSWTPDQIYFRLCDEKITRTMGEKVRTKKMSVNQMTSISKDGYLKIRGPENKLFYTKVGGDGKLIPAEEMK